MAFNFSPKIVTNGLVFYADAANTKSIVSGSTTWNDLSRNQVVCNVISGVTVYDTGSLGSIVFNGTVGYLSNSGNTYNANSGSTMSCWFNPSTLGSFNVIFSHDSNTNNGYRIQINSSRLTFTLGTTQDYITNYTLSTNMWYNAVACVSGSVANIYLNSNLISTFNIGSMLGSPNLFRIGRNVQQDNYHFIGKISNVSLYNRALSSQEVLQNYNATKTRFGL